MSVEHTGVDWITLDGAVNARVIVPGVLLRSDNLQGLSERDVELLVGEHGLEVVIDLRTDVEVVLEGPGPLTAVEQVRIEHRSLHPETKDPDDLVAGAVNPWAGLVEEQDLSDEDPVVRSYVSYLHSRPDSVIAAMRVIAQSDGSVLVHCAAGKDRTGVVVALALDAVDVDRDTIVEDYLVSRERIEQILTRLRGSETYRRQLEGHDSQDHAPRDGTMERFFELVDARFGGSAAWLTANGFTDEDLALLAARLTPDT
jgi:protein tyrosine/serine phosphatase